MSHCMPTWHGFAVMSADNIAPEMDGFHAFFESWISEQNRHLENLIAASKQNQSRAADDNNDDDDDHVSTLSSLVEEVMKHYDQYYKAKFQWAKQDVLVMFSPPWKSPLEIAFLWIGGWRPSMAFHLLYSKAGLQLESCFAELIRGLNLSTGDLGDLSECQLTMVDKLQRKTIQEERHISEKMAKLQETVADTTLVELSHMATMMMAGDNNVHEGGADDHTERVESTLASEEEGLEKMLQMADDLRMRTLKNIIQVLSPLQAVHFFIAAAELHLRVHDWGKKKEALRS